MRIPLFSCALVLCLLLGASHAYAQKDSAANPYNNTNDFGLSLGTNIFPSLRNEPGTYRFYIMKQFFENDNVLRLGLDVRIEPHSVYKYYFSGYYLGYARAYPMLKYHLWAYAGGDFLIQQDVDEVDIYQQTQNRFGVAPLGGLQYRIWPWLSVTTELSYAFSFRQTVLKTFNGGQEIVHSRKYDFSINPHRLFSLGIDFHF